MMAHAERAFAKENRCAILAVLEHQRLRSHIEHLVRCSQKVRFTSQHLGFSVIDEQNIHQLQSFGQFLWRALDPIIHRVAAGQAHTVHLSPDIRLQIWLNVGKKQKVSIFIFGGNARMKTLEDVQLGKIRLCFIEVVSVGAAPAKRLYFCPLDAPNIHFVF